MIISILLLLGFVVGSTIIYLLLERAFEESWGNDTLLLIGMMIFIFPLIITKVKKIIIYRERPFKLPEIVLIDHKGRRIDLIYEEIENNYDFL